MAEAVNIIIIRIHADDILIPEKITFLVYLGIYLLYNAFLLIYKMSLYEY